MAYIETIQKIVQKEYAFNLKFESFEEELKKLDK